MERLEKAGYDSAESNWECSEAELIKFLTALFPEVTATEDYQVSKTDSEKVTILFKAFEDVELENINIHKWDWVPAEEVSD